MTKPIIVHIARGESGQETPPQYSTFEIVPDGATTVLNILRNVYAEMDPTVAHRNFCCHIGVCLACYVEVNGEKVKGCERIVEPGEEITVGPVADEPLVRDTVVAF